MNGSGKGTLVRCSKRRKRRGEGAKGVEAGFYVECARLRAWGSFVNLHNEGSAALESEKIGKGGENSARNAYACGVRYPRLRRAPMKHGEKGAKGVESQKA
ncbi:hypothetical protein C8J57DRAFT_1260540 [Mycena rebaudengoi]|nr:hypothetical protein C8J57DRAFT_1260540 [Mycena rebaudengoi]